MPGLIAVLLQIYQAAGTPAAAEALDMADQLGRLAPGFEADIIALDGDPLKDLTAVQRVVFVMRGGVVYKWPGGGL